MIPPKVLFRECSSRARFEVGLESASFRFIRELEAHHETPWFVFCGVEAFAVIVVLEALIKIIRDSDVELVGMRKALERVDGEHRST